MGNQKRRTISLFGHFGSTNPGNEATLLAVVTRLRLLFPDRGLRCVCTSPGNVIAGLGIDAVPYTFRTTRIWNREIPMRERARQALPGLREEIGEYVRAWKTFGDSDLLIVPGTGLLTDASGLSGWGPYGLLKWSLAARARGCKLLFLSVGAGPVDTRPGRLFLRSALSLANYRSYRDAASRDIVTALGVNTSGDSIYPDLVFDLSPRSTPTTADRKPGRSVVGLGLMEYSARYSGLSPTGDTYVRYLESLAVFVGRLLDRKYDVRLLLGDADTVVIDDFREALREHLGSYPEKRVTALPIKSVEDVLSQLAETDLVVATRFHNVLMSLLLGKPTIAISFHHKVSSLMNDTGLSAYCQDIDKLNADSLTTQFEALARNSDELRPAIAHSVDGFRKALDEQYELLFVDASGESAFDDAVVAS